MRWVFCLGSLMNTVYLAVNSDSGLPASFGVTGLVSASSVAGVVSPQPLLSSLPLSSDAEKGYLDRLGAPAAFVRVPADHVVDVSVPDPDSDSAFGGGTRVLRAKASELIVLGQNGTLSIWPESALGTVFQEGSCPLLAAPSLGKSVVLPEPLARLVSLMDLFEKAEVSQAPYFRKELTLARADCSKFLLGLEQGVSGRAAPEDALSEFPASLAVAGVRGKLPFAVLSLPCRMGLIDLLGKKGLPPELPDMLKQVLVSARGKESVMGCGNKLPLGHRVREGLAMLGRIISKPKTDVPVKAAVTPSPDIRM
jgi:hypothetical protein